MNNTSICPVAEVEIRCQFTNIPGVSFIKINHRPQRGSPYTVSVDMLGIKTLLLEEAIAGLILNDIKVFRSEPFIKILNLSASKELFEAGLEGLAVISKMIKSVK